MQQLREGDACDGQIFRHHRAAGEVKSGDEPEKGEHQPQADEIVRQAEEEADAHAFILQHAHVEITRRRKLAARDAVPSRHQRRRKQAPCILKARMPYHRPLDLGQDHLAADRGVDGCKLRAEQIEIASRRRDAADGVISVKPHRGDHHQQAERKRRCRRIEHIHENRRDRNQQRLDGVPAAATAHGRAQQERAGNQGKGKKDVTLHGLTRDWIAFRRHTVPLQGCGVQ